MDITDLKREALKLADDIESSVIKPGLGDLFKLGKSSELLPNCTIGILASRLGLDCTYSSVFTRLSTVGLPIKVRTKIFRANDEENWTTVVHLLRELGGC